MATIDIIELTKTDTGEKFYPLTHVEAVIGLKDTQFFERYELSNGRAAVRVKQEFAGLFADGFISAGGLNASGGGGGGGGDTIEWEQLQTSGTQIATITINGVSTAVYAPVGGSGGGGTVTSVSAQGANGISVSGSPITGSGTLTIGISSSYKLPLTTEWDGKQDTIPDLATIRSNAAAGAAKVSNVQADWNASSGLARILNKPTIPAAQIQADWNQTNNASLDYIKNKPTIPTVNNATLTVQMNGVSKGTFSANASSNKTIDLGTVITSLSGYVTDGDMEAYVDSVVGDYALDSMVVHKAGSETITGSKTFTSGVTFASLGSIFINGSDEYLSNILATFQKKVPAMGSAVIPVYVSAAGTFTQASTYAGGTLVTLNGTGLGGSTASFYAPTSYGTSGYYLKASGTSGTAPSWQAPGSIASDNGNLVTGGAVYTALQAYLPLAGGTMTGYLRMTKGIRICLDENGDSYITRGSGTDNAMYIASGSNSIYIEGSETYNYGGLYPLPINGVRPNLGSSNWFWNNIYGKRWYPKTHVVIEDGQSKTKIDENYYIEFDETNNHFYVHGDLVVTGQVVAGQSA